MFHQDILAFLWKAHASWDTKFGANVFPMTKVVMFSLSVQQIHATNKWGRKTHEKTHGFWHASLTDQPNQHNQPNATSHQKSCRERGVSDTPKSRWFAIDCALKNVMECMIRMHYNTQLHTLTRQCTCAKKEPVLLKSCYFGWHGIFFLER